MPDNFHLSISEKIASLDLDQQESKVNLLTGDNLRLLSRLLTELSGHKDIRALVIRSRKNGSFIAGADIKEIEGIKTQEEARAKAKAGQDILNQLDDLPFPTIAVVNGLTLGGGCEFILACDYRIAFYDDRVQIGLPEVNLGILPGFGGTYRLPRLIGFSESLKMILGGKPVKFDKALKLGLLDRVLPVASEEAVMGFVADVLSGRYKRRIIKKGQQKFLDEWLTGQMLTVFQSRKEILKNTKGQYPAPLAALDLIKETFYETNRAKILAREAEEFGKLAVGDISKNLIKVFYLSEKYRKFKWPGVEEPDASRMDSVGVLGAGVMGGGIAHLLTSNDIRTRVKDLNYPAIGQALKVASGLYQKSAKQRRLSPADAQRKFDLLSYGVDYGGFQMADVVIEAVVENMDIKKKVFKELSEKTRPGCILATNTSALSVTEMAAQTKDPSKVVGIHFFNPVHRMPLVEIIRSPQTSDETTAAALALVKRLKKVPIVVNDACGFVVNRILLAYINEAGLLLEETGDMAGIDRVAKAFGMPMGPFELSDEVGLDVGYKVLHTLEQAFGERFKPSKIFEDVFKAGYLGKKTGQGFYIHSKDKIEPNYKIGMMLSGGKKPLNEAQARDRMTLIMINEAARILGEKVAADASVVDAGMIFGTGFPPFRGGLLRYADALGIETVVERLTDLKAESGALRFEPAPELVRMKAAKLPFYP